ncbi:MAG: methyl-accepting chemotaxis protein [Oscillospiraceae bacterium]
MKVKQKKLAQKIATTVGIVLVGIFAVLSIVIVNVSSNSTSHAITAQFINLAHSNGMQIQAVIDSASNTALNLNDYIVSTLNKGKAMTKSETPHKSAVFTNKQISDLGYEMENFIINTMWSAVGNNDDIAGVGVFFEQGKFDSSIKDYTLYVGNADANSKKSQTYGDYSSYSQKEYYKKVAETKKPYFSNPYVDQGVTMVTAAYPIMVKDEFVGVVFTDINVGRFDKITTTDSKFPTLYANILKDDLTIMYDSESLEDVGRNFNEYMKNPKEISKINDGMATRKSFVCSTTREDGRVMSRFFYPISVGEGQWWAQSVIEKDDMNKDITVLVGTIIFISVISLLVIILVVVSVLKKQLKPIEAVVKSAQDIANGNLNIDIEVKDNNEIGLLATTFKDMSSNLESIIGDVNYLLGEMANGNFRIHSKCADKYVGEYQNILLAIRNINSNLSSTLSEINQASDEVSSGSDQVSNAAQALSQGATEQASSIQELSATMADISEKIKANADNAKIANNLSNDAGAGVAGSNEKMHEMVIAMTEITDKANQIGKIIKTIDDIAFQTNILALNAAVEAARAGEAGKGFAVVADEVRNLAQKSAEAAKNTTALIEGTVQSVESGSKIADETAEALEEVVTKATNVAKLIVGIATASEEQATAAMQITMGIDQISSVVQTNSATAEESAAASEELNGQAQMLKNLVGNFVLQENAIYSNTPAETKSYSSKSSDIKLDYGNSSKY